MSCTRAGMASRSSLADLDLPPRQAIARPRLLQRTPRWVRALVIALVSVYVVYLLAANILLRTHLLRHWLTRDGGSLAVDYSSARSLLPGRVVVHDLRVRHQDRVVQLSVLVDRASFDIDLFALLQHNALLSHVKAEGVEYRLRQKLESLEGNEGRARAFPLIEGFPASPLAAQQPPIVQRPGSRTWTIEVRDLEASVREAWTMEYRFRGAASLTGGFHIEPKQIVQVFPSTMVAREGTLALGDADFITGGEWTLDAAVDPFVPDEAKGASVLRFITFAIHQHGGVVTIKPIGDTYLPPELGLDEGSGPIGIDVRVDHGIVQAGSRSTFATDRATFRGGALAITTDLDAMAEVDSSDPAAPHVVAKVSSKHGTLTPATDVSNLHAELALQGIDTTAPVVIDRLTGVLGSARSRDLRAWNKVSSLRSAKLLFTSGAATVSARGDYEKGALTGRIETKLDRVGFATGPFSMVCSGTSSTNLKAEDVSDAITFPDARVDVHDVAIKLLKSESQGMWMRARSNDTRMATTGPTKTDSHIAIESGPGEPTTKLFTELAHLPDIAADLNANAQLEARLELRVRHDDVAVDILQAKEGPLEGAGRLHHRPEKKMSGALLVSAGRLSAGIDITPTGVTIVPLANNGWLKETVAER